MKRSKSEVFGVKRFRLSHYLLGIAALYLLFICFKFPGFFETAATLRGDDSYEGLDGSEVGHADVGESTKPLLSSVYNNTIHRRLDNENGIAPLVPGKAVEENKSGLPPIKPLQNQYGRITGDILRRMNRTSDLSVLEKMADEAWTLGSKAWEEVDKYNEKEADQSSILEVKQESCPSWVASSGDELARGDQVMFLPCGLAAGSSITVVGTPQYAHHEYVRQRTRFLERVLLRFES